MSDLSFTPTFHPTPWIDNVDRVKAGGPDGFNARFEAIETDLGQVSTIVSAIGTRLDEAATSPPSGTQRLHVPLDAITTPPSGVGTRPGQWNYDPTGAIRPVGGPTLRTADATMDLSLPDQTTMISMRVRGLFQAEAASVTIRVQRSSLFNIGLPADELVTLTLNGSGNGNPYDLTVFMTFAFAEVDNGQFRYALEFSANLSGDSVPDPAIISVDSVELSYTLP